MPTNSKRRKRGRPAHSPTPTRRRQVSLAAGGGMRHEDIAIGLGIGVDTLRKYYEPELSVGASLRRMEVMKALHASALKGSSSAARAYLAVEPQLAAPPAEVHAEPKAEPKAKPLAAPLGKKDQAQAEAVTADIGTEWADLLRPAAPLQ